MLYLWLGFFLPLFFLWEEKRFARNISISNLPRTAYVLPATVCIPVVHRQKSCQLNNHFCLTNFQSFTYENPLIFINFGFLGHEFRVRVISLSFSVIDFFFFFNIYVYLLVCFLVLLSSDTALPQKLMKTMNLEKVSLILCHLIYPVTVS